jgi:hypothetical protein
VALSLTEQPESRSAQEALPELAAFWQALDKEMELFAQLGYGALSSKERAAVDPHQR